MNTELISKFENYLMSVKRDGIDKLLDMIRKSDFYTAPASTRFHGAYEGGLLEHTMNVLERALEKYNTPNTFWYKVCREHGYTEENIIISALGHDICKIYFYDIEYKNAKIYSEHGSKSDAQGRFDWEVVPSYTINDKMPLGHGSKSVIILDKYIKLETPEMYAIRWHMGAYEGKDNWNVLQQAMEKYPIILLIHEADAEASNVMEVEKGDK